MVTPDKDFTSKEVLSSIKVFKSWFVNEIKDLCTEKAYEKIHPVMLAYNNEDKNLTLT